MLVAAVAVLLYALLVVLSVVSGGTHVVELEVVLAALAVDWYETVDVFHDAVALGVLLVPKL